MKEMMGSLKENLKMEYRKVLRKSGKKLGRE